MQHLNYRIGGGGLRVDKDKLLRTGDDPDLSSYKYVVKGEPDTAFIYVIGGDRPDIATYFGVDEEKRVSGGSLHLDKGILVMDDYSQWGTTPKEAAKEFAGLIMLELQSMGIEVTGVFANPTRPLPGMVKMHPYWIQSGVYNPLIDFTPAISPESPARKW